MLWSYRLGHHVSLSCHLPIPDRVVFLGPSMDAWSMAIVAMQAITRVTIGPTEGGVSIRDVLRSTKFCWIGKHVNIVMKPTNSPTQGQPNPRKNRLKVAFGATFFPQQIIFRGLGLVLCRKQTARNLTQSNSPQTPYYFEVYRCKLSWNTRTSVDDHGPDFWQMELM